MNGCRAADNESIEGSLTLVEQSLEVLAHLVVAAVFKTVESYVNHAAGGFDSHALPFLQLAIRLGRNDLYRPYRKSPQKH